MGICTCLTRQGQVRESRFTKYFSGLYGLIQDKKKRKKGGMQSFHKGQYNNERDGKECEMQKDEIKIKH